MTTHPDLGLVAVSREPSADGCCAPDAPAMTESTAAEVAAVAKALADPVRARLYAHIAATPGARVCSCHMPEQLGVGQSTLSHHLGRLVAAGLVDRSQAGRWAYYTARTVPLAEAIVAAATPPTTSPRD
ncbi:ArsR/SmtB family transcription factor [Georgenia sp. Z1344]|uniref:ArsR/SmtB family transcription factor n=1 Tax=Georgenia sp. Z1344 TaxID=3416706 RepID=UPI003CFAE992